MRRRQALGIVLAVSVLAPICAAPQPAGRIHRIGVLLVTSRTRPNIERLLVPFDQALRERGYVEGRNLFIEWREAQGQLERLPALAADLVARKVDLIVAGAGAAAVAAKKATDTIPIVFVTIGDPVRAGLVKSFARPGGNVTGFSNLSESLTQKQLELLREVLPHLSRLSVIHSPGDADLDGAFRAIERECPDGLQVFLTVATYLHRTRIAEFAAAQRIPAVYGYVEYVEAGGLMSYGFSYADNWRRTAAYVDRILKGEKPGDLPVQQPQTPELAVNLKSAKALGITIPQSVLLRANELIR